MVPPKGSWGYGSPECRDLNVVKVTKGHGFQVPDPLSQLASSFFDPGWTRERVRGCAPALDFRLQQADLTPFIFFLLVPHRDNEGPGE
ncbi:hypothetical protein PAPYR_10501 [Paratrimastix pyriformis]|uniref:Uncharacterized protein n=1 Tax=Paratrimastix pyriformis TaxID=342808 RepID=A0ABQ8U5S5_9EUKA|nr:hypothetical protein PAPYR_10501 [Paratrimastix pyriformis]